MTDVLHWSYERNSGAGFRCVQLQFRTYGTSLLSMRGLDRRFTIFCNRLLDLGLVRGSSLFNTVRRRLSAPLDPPISSIVSRNSRELLAEVFIFSSVLISQCVEISKAGVSLKR